MGEKCIIYISSTNYKLVSAGTEKFMGGVIDSFKEKNVHALQFFPLVNINNRFERIGVERNYITTMAYLWEHICWKIWHRQLDTWLRSTISCMIV